jgi:hypothetical protein
MIGEGIACGAVLNWVADTEGPVEERICPGQSEVPVEEPTAVL